MYRAPLKDIRFTLNLLNVSGQLRDFPAFSEFTTEYQDAILEQAAHFAEKVLSPINTLGDAEGARLTASGVTMPSEFLSAYQQFVAAGWMGLLSGVAYGGIGAPCVLGAAVEEIWAGANLAFKLCPMLTRGAVEAIERCGSDDQKRRYLTKMVSGEWTGTMNLTEPQAGSDLSCIRTRAVVDNDIFRIFGQKIFITYGDHDLTPNIIHLVLARIEGSPPGTKGISLFIVPKVIVEEDGSLGRLNDVRCVSIEHKLGIRASPTCVMRYGEVRGAVGYLVGEPNRGLEYMFVMMNTARLAVGLEGYALAERAYQNALAWGRSRIQGRPNSSRGEIATIPLPIVDHADVKRMLMTMKAYADAARSLALYGALQIDVAKHALDPGSRALSQSRADVLIPIIKGWSTETGVLASSLGIQVYGGMGYVEATGAAQTLRDARITTIYEGTTGIQAIDLVGRKLCRDGGAAMSALIADMTAELQGLESAGSTDDKNTVIAAFDLLTDCTAAVLELARRSAEHAQAVAVPYLMLCGTVFGAWTMQKANNFASYRMESDPPFYAGKQQICRFYLHHLLPDAFRLARIVKFGADCVVESNSAFL